MRVVSRGVPTPSSRQGACDRPAPGKSASGQQARLLGERELQAGVGLGTRWLPVRWLQASVGGWESLHTSEWQRSSKYSHL